jgi:hypothetical protein
MVDTYYDKMDRGAVPRLPGYQGMVARNAVMAPGQFVAAGGTGGIYGRPGRRRTKTDDLLDRTAKLQAEANAANQARYDEARGLVGFEAPDAWHKAGFGSPEAYQIHKAKLAKEAADASTPLLSAGYNPATVGAQGGPVTPQALASRVQAKQRGIYNSSTALNREAVTNSLALADADRANRATGMQEVQLNEALRRSQANEADQLLGRRLELLYSKNDIAPNLDRVMQTAATEGQGSTEGMSYPMGGGGGGGGSPQRQQQGMSKAQRDALKKQQEAYQAELDRKAGMRAVSYGTSRALKRTPRQVYAAAGSPPIPTTPPTYGGDLWRRATQGIVPRTTPLAGPRIPLRQGPIASYVYSPRLGFDPFTRG